MRAGEQAAKLGRIAGCSLNGEPEWVFVYVHRYDREEGCVRGPVGVWD